MLFSRRSAPSATPAELLESVRAAQEAHAAQLAAAHQRLLDEHNNIFLEATSRKETIEEQISLLTAEKAGLSNVVAAASGLPRQV